MTQIKYDTNEFAYMHEKENVQSEINWTAKEKGENGWGIGMGQEKAVFACQYLMGEKWANKRVRNGSVFEMRDRCEPLYVWRYHVKVVFMAWVCLNCYSVFLLWHLLLHKSQRLMIVALMSSCTSLTLGIWAPPHLPNRSPGLRSVSYGFTKLPQPPKAGRLPLML